MDEEDTWLDVEEPACEVDVEDVVSPEVEADVVVEVEELVCEVEELVCEVEELVCEVDVEEEVWPEVLTK